MKNSEIVDISNKMSSDIKFSTDTVRLLAPKLLNYAENKRDFIILFELSKFQATRNQIVSIIKKDLNIHEKLKDLIKRKTNKSIVKKIKDIEERIND
ncbi:hypothetical protein [Candidatus Pelagibacter sp. HIMB1709]|uniref:hypothetical protein n=1 Tax=Candidatus Pelagibacter sp. HIMB1709 TaxID=3413367 RepID=UPI003F8745D4